MLDPSADIFACRFYAPAEGAAKLSCGWALGYYHALAQQTLVELNSNVIKSGAEVNKYGEGKVGPKGGRRISSVVPIALKEAVVGQPKILQMARRRSMMTTGMDLKEPDGGTEPTVEEEEEEEEEEGEETITPATPADSP